MKTFTVLFVFALASLSAAAQNVDYNKIILPDGAVVVDLEEKLVQLAWRNNPQTKMAADAVTEAREQFEEIFGVSANGIRFKRVTP